MMSRKVDQGRFVRNLALSLTVGIVVQLVSVSLWLLSELFSMCRIMHKNVPDNA